MPFVDNWHVGAICEHLEAVKREEIQKLLINVPPGHAKSLIVSVLWPAWVWTIEPSWRAIFASYADALSIRDSQKCRTVLESEWYIRSFTGCPECARGVTAPHDCKAWSLSGDQNVKSYYKNTATGERLSISVGGKGTGFRGHCVAVDDPLNIPDMRSKLERDRAIYWWDITMSSRLNDLRRGARLCIMQRGHEEDLSGHILQLGGYEHLMLPSLFEGARKTITFATKHVPAVCELRQENAADMVPAEVEEAAPVDVGAITCTCPRVKLWEDPRTIEGDLLFKRLFPAPVLAQAKIDLKSAGFAGQHQQRPAPEDGALFKKAWWRFFRMPGTKAGENMPRPLGCWQGPALELPPLQKVIISLDAAFKDLESSDFVVFQVWGTNRADRFLLDQTRARRDFTDTVKEFKRLCKKWPQAKKKIVEDKANGTAVINTLRKSIGGIVAINPDGGKESRATAVQPQIESGNVYLLDGAAWVDEYVAEFVAFPNGKNDDQVDTTTQALLALDSSAGMSRALNMSNM